MQPPQPMQPVGVPLETKEFYLNPGFEYRVLVWDEQAHSSYTNPKIGEWYQNFLWTTKDAYTKDKDVPSRVKTELTVKKKEGDDDNQG